MNQLLFPVSHVGILGVNRSIKTKITRQADILNAGTAKDTSNLKATLLSAKYSLNRPPQYQLTM